MQKEELLERIGLGKVKLPRLPLEEKRYHITGGNDRAAAIRYLASLFARPSLKDVIAPLDQTECTHPTGDLAHIGATLEGASAAPLPRTAINGGDCCPFPKLGHTATPSRGRMS